MNKRLLISGGILIGVSASMFFLFSQFGPVDPDALEEEVFIVIRGTEDDALEKLEKEGYIKNTLAFHAVMTYKGEKTIKPGGYLLSKKMSAGMLADAITAEPDMIWVTIPEGLRKEEIGERMATALGWSDEELDAWNTTYTAMTDDQLEGVYFPDTYLIPVNENGLDVAKRMQNHFNDQFAPYIDQFAQKDIIWTTGIRLASVVQREAAGTTDMPLIAGILWNRLLKGQNLEVDATVQYARGKTNAGWWVPIKPEDIRTIDSPYNTYKNKGLPPHPICNPGIAAIESVLDPEETDCLYYLHSSDRQIHCAVTYEEHQENIQKYLR